MDLLVFYFMTFALLGLIAVSVWLAYAYLQLQGKLVTLAKQNMYLKNQNDDRREQILLDAHNQALIIIDQATKKASQIMTQAQQFDHTAEGQLSQKIDEASRLHAEELKKATQDLLALYKDALEKVKQEDITHAANISKNIDALTEKELAQLHQVLSQQTIQSEKLVQEKIAKDYQILEEELKRYKETRMKEIEDSLLQIVQNVTEIVLQRQLSVVDQEQLVYEALTKVKEQVKI